MMMRVRVELDGRFARHSFFTKHILRDIAGLKWVGDHCGIRWGLKETTLCCGGGAAYDRGVHSGCDLG